MAAPAMIAGRGRKVANRGHETGREQELKRYGPGEMENAAQRQRAKKSAGSKRYLERVIGIEPTTFSLGS